MYYRLDIHMHEVEKDGEEQYFHTASQRFEKLDEVSAFLKANYTTAVQEPYMQPDENDTEVQVGYKYEYENADWSHFPVEKWQQVDYVYIYEVDEKRVLLQ